MYLIHARMQVKVCVTVSPTSRKVFYKYNQEVHDARIDVKRYKKHTARLPYGFLSRQRAKP